MVRHRPHGTGDVVSIVHEAAATGQSLSVEGSGSRRSLGHPTDTAAVLDLGHLTGIVDYQPAELVLTALPATPLTEIVAALATEGQMLAFEPSLRGTLGGALATNDAGPRRFRLGAARDHLLGFEGVTGRGEGFVAGGRVVKNVTGYDLSKLVCGSFGTLAVLTLVHVKVWPAPPRQLTLVRRGQSVADAVDTLRAAVSSPHDPTGAAFVDGVTAVRIEGPERSVAHRGAALKALLRADEILEDDASARFWAPLRDAEVVHDGASEVWCVSLPPADAAAFVQATAPDRVALDHAGGRVWLGFADRSPDVRAALPSGHATLVTASPERKQEVGVFQPRPAGLSALEQRVKAQFDPEGILEPGRMGAGR